MRYFAIAVVAGIFLNACHNNISEAPAASKADVLAINLDTAIRPGEDIFMYANGGWISKNPIPGEEAQWGIGNLVIDENTKRLREISESAAKEKAAKGTASQKIGDFWLTAMDTAKIESDGVKPLQPYLDKISAITETKSLQTVFAELDAIGVNGPINFDVSQEQGSHRYSVISSAIRLAG